jgi:hypothetical protein
MVCRVRLDLHPHPAVPGWCIGSGSLARPAVPAENRAGDAGVCRQPQLSVTLAPMPVQRDAAGSR